MTTRRIRYVGPPSHAVSTATRLADAEGVDLVASEPPVRSADVEGAVILAVSVDGTDEAVQAAVERARADLPSGTTLDVE